MLLEHRAADLTEFKALDAKGAFEGYGSIFGVEDSYSDVVQRGAFADTLKEWRAKGKLPKLLLQHGGGGFFSRNADDMVPIGQWQEMREDARGLYVKGQLFDVDTDRIKSVYAAMKAGELDGLSIGFRTRKSEMDEETGIRTLTDIELWEVSVVTFPANDPARVSAVKSGDLPDEATLERLLREAGLSRSQAKGVIASGYRTVLREAASGDEFDEAIELISELRASQMLSQVSVT